MDQHATMQKVFLLSLGVYLFATVVQIERTHAHMPDSLQQAFHTLSHLDLADSHYRDAGLEPEIGYLPMLEP